MHDDGTIGCMMMHDDETIGYLLIKRTSFVSIANIYLTKLLICQSPCCALNSRLWLSRPFLYVT